MQQMLLHGADTRVKDKTGMTLLHCATTNGHDEATRWLLNRTNVNAEDLSGKTALHNAAATGKDLVIKW
jgi:ankyrin repeat protein